MKVFIIAVAIFYAVIIALTIYALIKELKSA